MSSASLVALDTVVSVLFVPCSRLGGWGGTPAGDAGGVGDAGGEGVSIRTLMQSYMGRPSSKSTGALACLVTCWLVYWAAGCWAAACLMVMLLIDLDWLMMRMVPFLSSRLKKCSPLMSKSARL